MQLPTIFAKQHPMAGSLQILLNLIWVKCRTKIIGLHIRINLTAQGTNKNHEVTVMGSNSVHLWMLYSIHLSFPVNNARDRKRFSMASFVRHKAIIVGSKSWHYAKMSLLIISLQKAHKVVEEMFGCHNMQQWQWFSADLQDSQ